MNARPHIPSETDPSAEARRERLLDRQLQMLDRLAEVGLEIAVAIGDQVKAAVEVDPAPAADPQRPPSVIATLNVAALAYGRSARAVRMSLALQSQLLKAGEQRPAAVAEAKPALVRFSWLESLSVEQARRIVRVERLVRRVAEDDGRDREAAERLAVEAAERLEDRDRYGDVTQRPVGEILAHICQDLGLDPDWGRLAEEAWAREEIAAGDPGSPFAAWMAPPSPEAPPYPGRGPPDGMAGRYRLGPFP